MASLLDDVKLLVGGGDGPRDIASLCECEGSFDELFAVNVKGYLLAAKGMDVGTTVYSAAEGSCEPNVGVRGQVTFVAMRAIAAGSELTIDYAMIDGDPAERMECACGIASCRGATSGAKSV